MGRGCKNLEKHDRKNLDCLKQTVSRNKDVKVIPAGEVLEGSEA